MCTKANAKISLGHVIVFCDLIESDPLIMQTYRYIPSKTRTEDPRIAFPLLCSNYDFDVQIACMLTDCKRGIKGRTFALLHVRVFACFKLRARLDTRRPGIHAVRQSATAICGDTLRGNLRVQSSGYFACIDFVMLRFVKRQHL